MSKPHRDYFNRLAPEWHEKMPGNPDLKEYLIRFGIARGDRVLDIGAGTGRMTRHIAELTGESGLVVSEDIAEEMLIEGKRRFDSRRIHFTCDDTCALAFRDDSFDKALCFSAFPHFLDHRQALSEMHRVLRPGGRLLILHTSSSRDLNAFHASLDGVVREDRLPSAEKTAGMMRETGFDVETFDESENIYWVEGVKL